MLELKLDSETVSLYEWIIPALTNVNAICLSSYQHTSDCYLYFKNLNKFRTKKLLCWVNNLGFNIDFIYYITYHYHIVQTLCQHETQKVLIQMHRLEKQ